MIKFILFFCSYSCFCCKKEEWKPTFDLNGKLLVLIFFVIIFSALKIDVRVRIEQFKFLFEKRFDSSRRINLSDRKMYSNCSDMIYSSCYTYLFSLKRIYRFRGSRKELVVIKYSCYIDMH